MKNDSRVAPDDGIPHSGAPDFEMSPNAIERRLYELCCVSRLAIELSNSVIVGRVEDLIERNESEPEGRVRKTTAI